MEKQESKVDQALRLVEEQGMTVYAAAKQAGVPATSVYSARERRKLKVLQGVQECPCCGQQALRDQMKLDVLTASARKAIR